MGVTIDGDFDDWAAVPAYSDPEDDQHDTDHDQAGETPSYVDHPDVDLLAYRVTHDAENFYFYFQSRGAIGRTNDDDDGNGLRAGRYYVIVTIDVDQDDATGYPLYEGGYYTGTTDTDGYDVNGEIEFYDGAFNTGHYLQHGAQDPTELEQAFADQSQGLYDINGPETQGPFAPGFVNVRPGSYDFYTQWVYKENDPELGNSDSITFVQDRGPVVPGIVSYAISADGRQLEMKVPFKGFLADALGIPIIGIGQTVNLSFSLEASGELSNEVSAQNPNGLWASDTGEPIVGYYLGPPSMAAAPPDASLVALPTNGSSDDAPGFRSAGLVPALTAAAPEPLSTLPTERNDAAKVPRRFVDPSGDEVILTSGPQDHIPIQPLITRLPGTHGRPAFDPAIVAADSRSNDEPSFHAADVEFPKLQDSTGSAGQRFIDVRCQEVTIAPGFASAQTSTFTSILQSAFVSTAIGNHG